MTELLQMFFVGKECACISLGLGELIAVLAFMAWRKLFSRAAGTFPVLLFSFVVLAYLSQCL